jgi:protein SCO1/2
VERKTLWVGIVLLAVIGLSALVILLNNRREFRAAVFEPRIRAADFELTDQYSRPYRLSDQGGRIVLVFFGFTNCPDVCPLTMAKVRQVFEMLGAESQNLQAVFVTTDPKRDTPAQLQAFIANFNRDFVGLTGTREELQQVWSDYGVTVLDEGETHSTRVYVIDQQGDLRMTFYYEMDPADMAADLRLLLRGN